MSDTAPKSAIWNEIYQCMICRKWYEILKKQAYIVTQIRGMQVTSQNPTTGQMTLVPMAQMIMLDEDCFKELNLREDEPKIAIARNMQAVSIENSLKKR